MKAFRSATYLAISTMSLSTVHSDTPSLAEQLGYKSDAILLIVHADDLGVAHSENAASFEALENGSASSASIMMPTPWVKEVAAYAKQNQQADLGLHLTLTSEWDHYKWRPLSPVQEVPSLLDSEGFLPDNTAHIANNASLEEVETELRAQIGLAQSLGIDFTHIDAHMGAAFSTPELTLLYLKLAHEYQVPALLVPELVSDPEVAKQLLPTDVITDSFHLVPTEAFPDGMADHYANTLENIGPGFNVILIHAAFDDAEMQAITVNHPHWGAQWRQIDYDFFTSKRCAEIIERREVQLITWRQIRDQVVR